MKKVFRFILGSVAVLLSFFVTMIIVQTSMNSMGYAENIVLSKALAPISIGFFIYYLYRIYKAYREDVKSDNDGLLTYMVALRGFFLLLVVNIFSCNGFVMGVR